jgi:hypothetical protein
MRGRGVAVEACGRTRLESISSVEWRSVDDLDEHDHVIDHIEDEHA